MFSKFFGCLFAPFSKVYSPKAEAVSVTIDWSDPKAKISQYFTVRDACLLPSWGILHQPSEAEKANILAMAKTMDQVREFLAAPVVVHCWIRPISVNCPGNPHHGQSYNSFVGGAKASAHIDGNAVDWHAIGIDCDTARARLEPKLAELGLRMERLPGAAWVHNDRRDPGAGPRYFIP